MSQAWIKLTNGNNGPLTIFCFPYAGGTAQVFLGFAPLFPVNVNVYALELPGRGRRFCDDLLGTIDEMVAEASRDIQFLMKDNTEIVFFGHSLGGLLAFETARELRRKGQPLPRNMFISAVRAPHLPHRDETVHDLPYDAFVKKIIELDGTPEEILANEEMLELMVPILQKDFQAYETYQYKVDDPLPCPITVLGGAHDRVVNPEHLENWDQHTSAAFTSHLFDGGHFFLHSYAREITDMIIRTIMLRR